MLYHLLASLSEELLTVGDVIFSDKRPITIHTSTIFFIYKVAEQQTLKNRSFHQTQRDIVLKKCFFWPFLVISH